ncbi:MAG: VWA domain-containing protein [Pyrinomonadaceae bacterium]
MKTRLATLLICALVGAPLPAHSQTPPAEQQDEVVRVNANEIKLDAVVRDKKGHVVTDLKPSDFEVYEDGVRQQVTSFRLIRREPPATVASAEPSKSAAPAGTPAAARPAPPRAGGIEHVGAVAFVFDRLAPDARARARQAALAYLSSGLRTDDFAGVFGIDLSLRVLQPFTNNEQLVRQAIERAASHSSSSHPSNTGQIAEVSQSEAVLQQQSDAMQAQAGEGGAGAAQATGSAAGNQFDLAFAEMTRRSLETYEILEHNQQGYATTNSLLAVVNSLAELPGRKVLLFFSEGISLPTAVVSHFRTVISNANRANVSIYSIDAAGLRATSADADAGRAMTALGQQRIRQANSNRDPNASMMRDLERNEDLLRSNPNTGLGELAEETGGFLISDTNNPGPRLRQVDEDLHTYYVLSYVPSNQHYDGRFRQISVKLARPSLEVQARRGYYAISGNNGSPILGYEAPVLALLSGGGLRSPVPFPVHAAAFSFPQPRRPGLVPIVVEIPAGTINYEVNAERKTYRADFSVVALVKDEAQRVVKKLSNQFLLTGPLDKLAEAKRGAALFYRETDLPPGHYTIAAAVYDALTERGTTMSSSIDVPANDETKPRLASVVIIKRVERVTTDDAQQASNPFRFGEVLVYPNLEEPLRKTETKELPFLLTLYNAPGAPAPQTTLEIKQGDRTLARADLTLPAPDAAGRIQYASSVPVDKLRPGDYELQVTARAAGGSTTRVEHFTLQP